MLLIYNTLEWPHGRPSRERTSSIPEITLPGQTDRPAFEKKAAYSGELCPNSKKRLTKAINLLVAVAEPKPAMNFKTNKEFMFRVNFVTLTLPAPQGTVTDKEIKKKCLDPWIKSMRRRHKLKSYVWRAERQFNGNLHFHITTDTYLPYDDLCHEWNHQLRKTEIMDRHKAKHGHDRPNSTDIHSVQQIHNLAGYMVKYMSKNPEEHLKEINEKRVKAGKHEIRPERHPFRSVEGQPEWNQPIDGKVWDCSANLKTKARCECVIDSHTGDIIREIADSYPDECKQTDHCFIIFTSNIDLMTLLKDHLLDMWVDYLHFIRTYEIRPVSNAPAEPPEPEIELLNKPVQLSMDI